jgi:hypothetical protein
LNTSCFYSDTIKTTLPAYFDGCWSASPLNIYFSPSGVPFYTLNSRILLFWQTLLPSHVKHLLEWGIVSPVPEQISQISFISWGIPGGLAFVVIIFPDP